VIKLFLASIPIHRWQERRPKKSIDDEVVIKNALKESRYIVVDISYKKPAGN
jgi:hypothetical protein